MTTNHISRWALAPVPNHARSAKSIITSRTGASARRLITIYTSKLASLDELKQSLLQKAFTGQLTTDLAAV